MSATRDRSANARIREVLEAQLPKRLTRYVNGRDRYVVERALVMLGVRATLTGVAERQVRKVERDVVDRRIRDGLLAGGWPGQLQELVDRLEDAPAPVVPIAAAPSSTATGRRPLGAVDNPRGHPPGPPAAA